MGDKSERAYWWIDARANALSKWIDANRGRLLLIAVFAWMGIWGLLLEGREDLDTFGRLIRGMGPELAGIVIAAVTIDALAERRQRQSRKKQLIRQLGSKYRDVTEMALLELRHEGWLDDGSLRGVNLTGANLSGANLIDANLSDVTFWQADLSEAFLMDARLPRSNFNSANLRNAIARGADLREANLEFANLAQIHLEGADLHGARLWRPNLGGVHLDDANLSNARLVEADLIRASLCRANLEMAYLHLARLDRADLPGANLNGATLSGASLREVDLTRAQNWSIGQLASAEALEGAIMPDGAQLRQEGTENRERIDGLTFGEWKAQYLATHGGDESDIRDPR